MTAEIGVMNRVAVALAADSAVTLGGAASKTYASADKLFQLSSIAPVGVMIYGNATFLGVPWETIIKVHRRKLGKTLLPTVKAYADHLLGFLKEPGSMLAADTANRYLASIATSLLITLRQSIAQRLTEKYADTQGFPPEAIDPTAKEVLERHLAGVRKVSIIRPGDAAWIDEARTSVQSMVTESCRTVFDGLPLAEDTIQLMKEYCTEALTRRHISPHMSGIVVAGFGEEEYFPSLIRFECDGRIHGELRITSSTPQVIEDGNNAGIFPFAQKETVTTFLEGIDESYRNYIRASVVHLFDGAFDLAFKRLKAIDEPTAMSLGNSLQPDISAMLKALLDDWDEKRKTFWAPMLQIVASLPKDELAFMAEALVNLTKFRRRVTPESESVGGPIDVAVITKGDGFIWVKRKHYFDPALNPRAMAQYSAEGRP